MTSTGGRGQYLEDLGEKDRGNDENILGRAQSWLRYPALPPFTYAEDVCFCYMPFYTSFLLFFSFIASHVFFGSAGRFTLYDFSLSLCKQSIKERTAGGGRMVITGKNPGGLSGLGMK